MVTSFWVNKYQTIQVKHSSKYLRETVEKYFQLFKS